MLLVVGGGIAGITTAVEAAEAGESVTLVEREPFVGGRVARSHRYFPKLCPPTCGLEINIRRLERQGRIRVLTSARVVEAARTPQGWAVTVARAPAYVDDKCTGCGACSAVCPARVPDPFNLGMGQVPAVRRAFADAWPRRFSLDRDACPEGCTACVGACSYGAVDLAARERRESITAAAVVLATGWRPYPLENLVELGGGQLRDVIANVQLERLAATTGPTGGKILRPSDNKEPRKVAFVQCAGSRDVKHLPYCSGVCCLASMKQVLYVREKLPEAEVELFYIDRRTPGRNEELLRRAAAEQGVKLTKGKVGRIERRGDGSLLLRLEDVESGVLREAAADLVVLATGMVPETRGERAFGELLRDEDGFALDAPGARLFVAGVARRPEDVAASVRDATAAAARGAAACRAAGAAPTGGA